MVVMHHTLRQKSFEILYCNLKLLIPIVTFLAIISVTSAYGYGGTVELVLSDIWIEPEHPQAGDKVTIFGKVYNAGTDPTENIASVVTAGFIIDGEVRKIVEIGNVKPGAGNEVTISSGPIWSAEWGKHNMTVIANYHHSISDYIDNPANNIVKKIFIIEPVKESQISLDVSPSYIIPQKNTLITINGSLTDTSSGAPLPNQKVTIAIGNSKNYFVTNKDGKFYTTKALTFSEQRLLVTALFEGNFPYLASNHTNYVFNLPQSTETSALVLQIKDPSGKYDFKNLSSEIAVFQDSYDTLFTKIQADKGFLLDNKTAWVALPGNHSYLEEVYANGRFFFSSDWKKISENSVFQENLYIPETAQIRFHVTDVNDKSLDGVAVKNWIYSAKTDGEGFTSWIDMLPTRTKKEPYVAVASTDDGKIFRSEPFFVTSGEKKIIEIKSQEPEVIIPSWIRNNAKWWSSDQITTSDFAKGIQYLIEQKIIIIPSTSKGNAETSQVIPLWVKNNAKWWSEGQISDRDFVLGIQYLIQIGIIHV